MIGLEGCQRTVRPRHLHNSDQHSSRRPETVAEQTAVPFSYSTVCKDGQRRCDLPLRGAIHRILGKELVITERATGEGVTN
jgi:hypothetical protein